MSSPAGAGLKSNQNITNLASFLALWDLFWEKIVVLQEAGGTEYKCEVVLKLSRKTTVDLVAGRYDVIGFKRGNKPYKKFRDAGMIELKLADNVIQSEMVDVSADVQQPQPDKAAKDTKKKKGKKSGIVDGGVHKEEDDDGEDDDLMSLIDDLVSIVESGNDDYISGVAFLVVSSMIDALAMQLKKTDKGGVFMEGPLIDLRSLPWESDGRTRVSGHSDQICYADAIRGEYKVISECTTSVAEVIDDLILLTEHSQDSRADDSTSVQRPMSSGVSVSLVMETMLQAVEQEGFALRSQARFRFEGPLIDLRSLPWESGARLNVATSPRKRWTMSEETSAVEAKVQGQRTLSEVRDVTCGSHEPIE